MVNLITDVRSYILLWLEKATVNVPTVEQALAALVELEPLSDDTSNKTLATWDSLGDIALVVEPEAT